MAQPQPGISYNPTDLGKKLCVAVKEGNLKKVLTLLPQGASPQFADPAERDLTPLHHAAILGNPEILRVLLSMCDSGVDCRDHLGRTPLHFAAAVSSEGGLLCVRLLLLASANPSATDASGKTPAYWAISNGRRDTAELLITLEFRRLTRVKIEDIATSSAATPLTWTNHDLQSDDNPEPPDRWRLLHVAAIRGHADEVRTLVDKHHRNVTAKGPYGVTPLHLAVLSSAAVTAFLFERGALIDSVDKAARTPLHIAAAGGDVSSTAYLLANCAKITAIDANRMVPLQIAAMAGNFDGVKLLLEAGADPNFAPPVSTEKGMKRPPNSAVSTPSPLLCAASKGHEKVAMLLLASGADLKAVDRDGMSTLFYAARFNMSKLVDSVFANQKRWPDVDINAKSPTGLTMLHFAVAKGNAEVTRTLRRHCARVDIGDPQGRTPLHLAAVWNRLACARELLAAPLNVDTINAGDHKRKTALHLAAAHGSADMVALLATHKAQIEARDDSNSTPLHIAASSGRADVVLELINHGADVNARDASSRTPLHIAIMKGHRKIARILLSKGADAATADCRDCTALHYAAAAGDVESAILLVDRAGEDACVDEQDVDGRTPQMVAVQSGHADLIITYIPDVGGPKHRRVFERPRTSDQWAIVALRQYVAAIEALTSLAPPSELLAFAGNPTQTAGSGVFSESEEPTASPNSRDTLQRSKSMPRVAVQAAAVSTPTSTPTAHLQPRQLSFADDLPGGTRAVTSPTPSNRNPQHNPRHPMLHFASSAHLPTFGGANSRTSANMLSSYSSDGKFPDIEPPRPRIFVGRLDPATRLREGRGLVVYNDNSRYRGQWQNDTWHGKGCYRFADGVTCVGSFERGLLHGKAAFTLRYGVRLEGEFEKGRCVGTALLAFPSAVFTMATAESTTASAKSAPLAAATVVSAMSPVDTNTAEKPHTNETPTQSTVKAVGSFSYADGSRYQGDVVDHMRHGRGLLIYRDGGRYEGEFAYDRFHGNGLLRHANGDTYDGAFKDGKYDGKGTLTSRDGSRYEGYFRTGNKHGKGIFFDAATGETWRERWRDGRCVHRERDTGTESEGNDSGGGSANTSEKEVLSDSDRAISVSAGPSEPKRSTDPVSSGSGATQEGPRGRHWFYM